MSKGRPLSQRADFTTRATHAYMLCGWHTRSDIPLTSVPTSVRGGESVDILIQIAPGHSPIANVKDRAVFEHSVECSLIRIKDVADFEVSGGSKSAFGRPPGRRKKILRSFFLGRCGRPCVISAEYCPYMLARL